MGEGGRGGGGGAMEGVRMAEGDGKRGRVSLQREGGKVGRYVEVWTYE